MAQENRKENEDIAITESNSLKSNDPNTENRESKQNDNPNKQESQMVTPAQWAEKKWYSCWMVKRI